LLFSADEAFARFYRRGICRLLPGISRSCHDGWQLRDLPASAGMVAQAHYLLLPET